MRRIDDDGARRLRASVVDDLAFQTRIELRVVALVGGRRLDGLRFDLSLSWRRRKAKSGSALAVPHDSAAAAAIAANDTDLDMTPSSVLPPVLVDKLTGRFKGSLKCLKAKKG